MEKQTIFIIGALVVGGVATYLLTKNEYSSMPKDELIDQYIKLAKIQQKAGTASVGGVVQTRVELSKRSNKDLIKYLKTAIDTLPV